MKKVLIGLAIAVTAFGASAQHHRSNSMIRGHGWQGPQYHHYHQPQHHARGNNWNWVVPAVIGGAVVYAATRPQVIEQPVIVQQAPVEVVYINGVAYRKQITVINGQYQEVLIRM
jgi:hypothetical protein